MGVTSGSFETTHRISGSYNTYAKFSWSQSKQSIANNETTITWKLVGCTANQYQWIHVYGISVTINGVAQSVSWSGDMYNGTQMASGTVTIPHGADGKKTFSASATIKQYSSGSSYSGSGSWELNQIARAATITSAPNFNDEDNPAISYSNPAGTAVSSLQACIASTNGQTIYVPYRDISKTGTSYTFNLTDSERNSLRAAATSNTLKVRFYVKTVIGSSTLYESVEKTLSIVNANPTFSTFTYADTNSTITGITGNNQILVQGKSTLKVTIASANKAVAKKSATMSTYLATISGLSETADYSTSNIDMTFASNAFTAGSQTLSVKATDSRGNSTTASKNVTVLAYANPVVNASATRLNNFENTTTLVVKGTYSPLTVNNVAKNTVSSVQYRYKASSTSTWGSWITMSGLSPTAAGAYTTTNATLNLDNNNSYDIEVKTTDKLGSTTVSLTVSAGIAIFRIGTDGYVYNNEQRILTVKDGGLGSALNITATSSNIDDLKMPGTYKVQGGLTEPFGAAWYGTILNVGDGNTYLQQFAVCNYNEGSPKQRFAVRSLTNGTWAFWQPLKLDVTGEDWQFLGKATSSAAVTNNQVLSVPIPSAYQNCSLKVLVKYELSADGWVDLRAYNTSGALIPTTINMIGCVSGAESHNGSVNQNYILNNVSVGKAYICAMMQATSLKLSTSPNYRSWVGQSGNGYQIRNISALHSNNDPVGSLRLYTGGTCSSGAIMKVWGMLD